MPLALEKQVPCFYRVLETRVEVWENDKCCGNTIQVLWEHNLNLPFNQALNQFSSFILVDSGKLPQRIDVKIPWSKADRKAKGYSVLTF